MGAALNAGLSERLAGLTSWHADWQGLRVAVLGLGAAGFSAADTLAELGARVLLVAREATEERRELAGVIGADYAELPDDAQAEALAGFDPELVVVSPGIPPAHPAVAWARERGIAVWGDVDLAWRLRDKSGPPAEWVVLTGSRGTAEAARLAATMLLAAGRRAAPAGDGGVSVLDALRDPAGFDVLVVELSGRHLHWLDAGEGPGHVAPLASACLSLSAEDEADWHPDRDAYRAAKAKVYVNTRVACVYNLADEGTRELVEEADVQEGCRAIGVGLGVPGPSDLGIVEDILVDRAFLDERRTSALELATVDELRGPDGAALPALDVLAAAALARAAGAPAGAVRAALRAAR